MLKTRRILKKIFTKRYSPYLITSNENMQSGRMSYHNGNFVIKGSQKVIIGNYCSIGKNVSIITENHDYNFSCLQGTFYRRFFNIEHPGVNLYPLNKERTKGPVVIGSDVWIADNASIMSGVIIGDGACIGNNSVVTRDVEPYSIVGGIPARQIKKRYSQEKIEFLESIQWWHWEISKIQKNKSFFVTNLNLIELEEIKNLIIE